MTRARAGAGSSGFGVTLIVGDALLLQGGGLLAAAVAVDGDHGGDAEPDAGGGAMSAATLPVSMAGPCRVISDKIVYQVLSLVMPLINLGAQQLNQYSFNFYTYGVIFYPNVFRRCYRPLVIPISA